MMQNVTCKDGEEDVERVKLETAERATDCRLHTPSSLGAPPPKLPTEGERGDGTNSGRQTSMLQAMESHAVKAGRTEAVSGGSMPMAHAAAAASTAPAPASVSGSGACEAGSPAPREGVARSVKVEESRESADRALAQALASQRSDRLCVARRRAVPVAASPEVGGGAVHARGRAADDGGRGRRGGGRGGSDDGGSASGASGRGGGGDGSDDDASEGADDGGEEEEGSEEEWGARRSKATKRGKLSRATKKRTRSDKAKGASKRAEPRHAVAAAAAAKE
eukprot:162902-Pleurochrysis_carterae.AAC.1